MAGLAQIIDAQHEQLQALGWRLLQPYRFGVTDEDHIEALLDMAKFPHGARVLDVGCGVGECARLMRAQRPDLDFVLVNFSQAQLEDCPPEMEQHHADAHQLPFADESFDAVMFNAALGNMDCMIAMAEASRVLKPGGVLFLNEVRRIAGDNDNMERVLRFRAYPDDALIFFAAAMGLMQTPMDTASVYTEYLREVWPDDTPATYSEAFAGTEPGLWRFVKAAETPIAAKLGSLFYRNANVALQVSGGKDSVAVLFLLRAWWDRLTVYWLNPGNAFPETVKYMEWIKTTVPNFKEVAGRQQEVIAQDGWPSDVLPQAYTTDGNFVFGKTTFKVQTRLSCCFRSLMLPMHEAMIANGVTCIIRGKRSEEADKSPTRTGTVIDGIELCYPIWDWSEVDVFQYLKDNGIPLPEYYEFASHSLDCMDCSAWWGEGLSRFLEARHPEQHKEYVRRVTLIKQAISEQMADCEV